MADTALRIVVTGRVQGVGFRAWTCGEARRRHIRGWVRNRRDGTVEALLIGPPDAIEAIVEACRRGPSSARVTEITRANAADDSSIGFEEHPTI